MLVNFTNLKLIVLSTYLFGSVYAKHLSVVRNLEVLEIKGLVRKLKSLTETRQKDELSTILEEIDKELRTQLASITSIIISTNHLIQYTTKLGCTRTPS